MLSLVKLNEMSTTLTTVDELQSFPFLNNPTTLSALKSEFSSYRARAAVEDIDPDIDIFQWWENHEKDLPHWASVPLKLSYLCSLAQQLLNVSFHYTSKFIYIPTEQLAKAVHILPKNLPILLFSIVTNFALFCPIFRPLCPHLCHKK